MAQEKQCKQLILTDDKNIFTDSFQPMQRLQFKFKADGIRNFMEQQKQRKQLQWQEYFYLLLLTNATLTT